ncbi:MAG: NADH-quinone oxidoreductase subunit J [Pseudomonadota bacterium]
MKDLQKNSSFRFLYGALSLGTCALVLFAPDIAWAKDVITDTGTAHLWAFRLFGVLTIIGAITTITRRNPVVAALCLVATLICTAGIYLMLHASFLAAIQVLVYAGAIMVLFIFVIMSVGPPEEQEFGVFRGTFSKILGVLAILALIVPLLRVLRSTDVINPKIVADNFGDVYGVGNLLFGDYLFPFEAISLLLLVAIVGAVVLTRRRKSAEKGAE